MALGKLVPKVEKRRENDASRNGISQEQPNHPSLLDGASPKEKPLLECLSVCVGPMATHKVHYVVRYVVLLPRGFPFAEP